MISFIVIVCISLFGALVFLARAPRQPESDPQHSVNGNHALTVDRITERIERESIGEWRTFKGDLSDDIPTTVIQMPRISKTPVELPSSYSTAPGDILKLYRALQRL